jgi:hypothetical protein
MCIFIKSSSSFLWIINRKYKKKFTNIFSSLKQFVFRGTFCGAERGGREKERGKFLPRS